MAQGLSKFIIQICAEKKDLGLKLMMRKLGKAIAGSIKDIHILFLQKSFNKNMY